MKRFPLVLALAAAVALAGCKEPNAPQPPAPVEANPPAAAEVPPAPTPASDTASSPALEGVDVSTALDQSYCNVESIGESPFAAGSLDVQPGQQIRGWLGHSTTGNVGSPVLLFMTAEGATAAGVQLQLAVSREDVANAYGGRADLTQSGFEAPVPALPAGTYQLLLHYTFDGKTYRCDNGRRVTIR